VIDGIHIDHSEGFEGLLNASVPTNELYYAEVVVLSIRKLLDPVFALGELGPTAKIEVPEADSHRTIHASA
jgi:hypothetical protein